MKKAIFFDRDGVINELIPRDDFYYSPRRICDFKIFPYVKKIITKVQKKGFLAIVVSNQPDISRGLMTEYVLNKMNEILYNELKLDDIFYCIHDDSDNCLCRKPKPGMIIEASKKWRIDLKNSLMVGDTKKDLFAARNARVNFILLNTKHNNQIQNCIKIDKLKNILKFI